MANPPLPRLSMVQQLAMAVAALDHASAMDPDVREWAAAAQGIRGLLAAEKAKVKRTQKYVRHDVY